MELSEPPSGPIPDETKHTNNTSTLLEDTVDCIAERLLSTSRPLPEHCYFLFQSYTDRLEALQKEAWFCHWGVVVSLCVYQQLISHVDIALRQTVAQSLGTFLAEEEVIDNTRLYDLIESEFKKHGIPLKPDMDFIHRELACTALHSTIVCYIRDIALSIHTTRQQGETETLCRMGSACLARNFFMRFAAISTALLDILYDAIPSLRVADIRAVGPA
jgi:hypothetical protein